MPDHAVAARKQLELFPVIAPFYSHTKGPELRQPLQGQRVGVAEAMAHVEGHGLRNLSESSRTDPNRRRRGPHPRRGAPVVEPKAYRLEFSHVRADRHHQDHGDHQQDD